jgi:ATP-dependent RNA helicase SUPV3L1/SUV3
MVLKGETAMASLDASEESRRHSQARFKEASRKQILRALNSNDPDLSDLLLNHILDMRDWDILSDVVAKNPTVAVNTIRLLEETGLELPGAQAHIKSSKGQRRARKLEAQEEERRRELEAAHALLHATGMADYPAFFPQARSLVRKITFHVGPTNSGKTHAAMAELIAADTGAYLAPLRLLALEGYDKLVGAGLYAKLLTGDDRDQNSEYATHVSSTVEMMDTRTQVDVAVIDEVQMLNDPERGWAWTRAIVGAPAERVLLVGSRDALPMVRSLCHLTGDDLEVIDYSRRSVLRASASLGLQNIEAGDAIVAFSRRELFDLREDLIARGHKIAMLYGGLSPEVRRSEAARFRSGEADVLIATDAIGMGLNLPLKRVILASGMKHDGQEFRPLTHSEIRQICGRAGRGSDDGIAAFLRGSEGMLDTSHLQRILDAHPHPHDNLPYVAPPFSAVETVSRREHSDDLPFILKTLTHQAMSTHNFRPTDMTTTVQAAEILRVPGLTLRERYDFSLTPVVEDDLMLLRSWGIAHVKGEEAIVPKPMPWQAGLRDLERTGKQLVAWIWLSRIYPDTFHDVDMAREIRSRIETAIKEALMRNRIPHNLNWETAEPSLSAMTHPRF